LLVASSVRADESNTAVDAQLYRPALDGNGIFSVERAATIKKYAFTLRLTANYADSPLDLDTRPSYGVDAMMNTTITEDGSVEKVLKSNLSFHLGLAFGITDRLTLGVEMPVQIQPLGTGYGERGAPVEPGGNARPGTGLYSTRPINNIDASERPTGDLRIGLKFRLFGGLALQVVGWVPFGDEDVFAGSRSLAAEPKVIYDILDGSFKLTLNVGARLRQGTLVKTKTTLQDGTLVDNTGPLPVASGPDPADAPDTARLFVGSELVASLGISYDVSDALAIGADVHFFMPLTKADSGTCTGECKDGDQTAELIAGVSYDVSGGLSLSAGAGAGLISDAARSPTFRVIAGLTWAPSGSAGVRVEKRGDRDGDRIADAADLCPDEPEDDDGFQDDDGCPELDNDLDGVLDAQDQCKDEPEDRDGYQDDDGCPDPDNDGDGVPDLTDRCPSEKEDMDGFDDGDGCPDEDNDGDGFIDSKDNCPDQPETVNGYQDQDGCPDTAQVGGPVLGPTSINLQGEVIDFTPAARGTRLTANAIKWLDVIVKIMNDNPGQVIRVEAYVEASGTTARSRAKDQALSAARAQEVRNYLIGKGGIRQDRVQAAGLGSSRPLDKAHPRDPKANRRIEFIRVTQ
jgi:outer membrane protein OmpA-like peptidoglycan-associated protein